MLNVIPRRVQQLVQSNSFSAVEDGIVLHLDISGFTSMTESLLELGGDGAEVLSVMINRVFSKAVAEIHSMQGDIADFEGDAITAVFPPDNPRGALNAASALETCFGRDPSSTAGTDNWSLTAKAALAAGTVEWNIIGRERLAFFVCGTAFSRVFEALAECETGSTSVHGSFSELVRRETGLDVSGLLAEGRPPAHCGPERIRPRTAMRFVSPAIISHRLTGEFRSIAPVFFHIREKTGAGMKRQAETALERISEFGGELSGLYCSTPSYMTGLALFGAPVSWENNTSRALECAFRLAESPGSCLRAGVSEGKVYAGMTGNSARCKYTVYGDTVNTAARLACRAEFGEVLVTAASAGGLRDGFSFSGAERWRPKGRTGTLQFRKLCTLTGEGKPGSFAGRTFGRSHELKLMLQRLKPLERGEFAGVTVVFGEPGIGKSRLLYEASEAIPFECGCYTLTCDDVLRKGLNPFVQFLREFFGQSASDPPAGKREAFEKRMAEVIEKTGPETDRSRPSLCRELARSVPFLRTLLGHDPEDPVISELTAEIRKEEVFRALSAFLRSLSLIRPLLLVMEDLHWMDADSIEALKLIMSDIRGFPAAVIASSRYSDDGSKPEVFAPSDLVLAIDLKGLDREASLGLMTDRLGAGPDRRLADSVLRSSEGNPFYIEQFCLHLRETGLIAMADGNYHLSSGGLDIPSGIRSILVARFDRLSHDLRRFLQTASVLGQEFSAVALGMVTESGDRDHLLSEGERLGLWSRRSGSLFSFNHILYRQTARSMLLAASLRRIHEKAAEAFIKLNAADPEPAAGEIALHLYGAYQIRRSIEWGRRALLHAAGSYMNTEAILWSDRLKEWILELYPECGRPELLLDILLMKDSILHALGRRGEQSDNLDFLIGLARIEKGWSHREADILKARGTYAWSLGMVDEALEYFRRGLDRSAGKSGKAVRGKLIGNIANIYATMGRFRDAEEYYDRAISIHRSLGDRKQEGITLGNLAITLRRTGREDEAEKCYKRALEIHRISGNRLGEERTLCGLGNLEEDPEDALQYFNSALSINREIGDRRNEADILSNIGRLETIRENFGTAAEYLQKALELHEEIGNPSEEADTHCLFGEMYYATGEFDRARNHLKRAVMLSLQTGSSARECICTGLLGLVEYGAGRLEHSLSCYSRCCELIEEYGYRPSIDESVQILRRKLLDSGVDGSAVPLPKNWLNSVI